MPSLKAYSGDLPYSYAAGLYPSLQLMTAAPERATRLLLSSRAEGEGVERLRALCSEHRIREEVADKALSRISGKQNCYAAVVFEKWQAMPDAGKPHIVLHHPMDEGNLGTIQRTMLGLGLPDLIVIRPAADPFDPKVVRASMGAVFSLRLKLYDDFETYRSEYPGHALYPFMLTGSTTLEHAVENMRMPYALVFGNEGSGLPDAVSSLGQAVRIPHSNAIDSLNLAIAAAIGAYAFVHAKNKEE